MQTMLTAFTMIQARPDAIKTIAQKLASLPHVNEVYSVTGEWDIIAIVRLKDYEKLAEVIPDEVSRLDGIIRTNTILAFRRFSPDDLEAAWSVGIE
jgi:DNA-binding Lrp family transcriptional regulator